MRKSASPSPSPSFRIAAVAVFAALATGAFAADTPARKPADLLRDFTNLTRDKNAAFEAVTNDYRALVALTNLTANLRADAARAFVNFHLDRGRRAEALDFAQSAATDERLPPDRRAELFRAVASAYASENKKDAFGAYRHDGFDKAFEIHGLIASLPGATPSMRISALRDQANMLLEGTRDIAGAEALLEKAIALPGLDAAQKAEARFNRAELDRRIRAYDKALPVFAGILADESLPDKIRRDAMHKTFAIANATGGPGAEVKARREAAAKYPRWQSEWDAIRCMADNGIQSDVSVPFFRKAVAEWEPNPSGKGFPDIDRLQKAFSAAGFDTYAREMPAVVAKIAGNPRLVGSLFNAMTGRGAGSVAKDARYPALLLGLLDQVPATNRPPAARLFGYVLGKDGCLDRGIALARQIVADPAAAGANADTTRRAAVETALADARGNGSRAVALLNGWLKANPPADNLGRASFLLTAVKRATILRQEDVARAIYAERAKLVRKEEPRSIPCPFIANPPQDLSDILRSDIYRNGRKGLIDRKFGDDLKFIIETDVTANRSLTEYKGKPFRPGEVFAFCDPQGVKIIVRQFYNADAIEKFKKGFGGFGGYEAYVATSADGPYTFLGFGPSSLRLDSAFLTQYDNETGYRNFTAKDGSAQLSHYVTEDGVASLLSFSWVKVFTDLPSNGDKWYFEPISWSNGGWTWGGSKGVHNRSSFGALVFEGITPAAAASIRRGILPAARGAFNAAIAARGNGCIEIWKDPELGDPAFYEACLKPLVARLSPDLAKVKADMSDADALDVYERSAKDWLNIEFIVSRLRTRYLARQFVNGAE